MRLNVAVIGVGRWGGNLVRTLLELPVFDLRAVCDPARVELGVPCFDDAEQLFDRTALDAVLIATPAHTHAALAGLALRRGVHAFVEKPLCTSEGELLELAAEAAGSSARIMVGHLLAFHPAFVELERQLRVRADVPCAGATIEVVRKSRSGADPGRCPWWSLAPHDLSLAGRVFGPVRRVSARRTEGAGVAVTLGYDRDNLARLTLATNGEDKVRSFRIVVAGTRLVFDDRATDKLVLEDRQGRKAIHVANQAPLEAELAHFAAAIRSGRPFETPFEEGAAVVRVLLAGQQSLDSDGTWVDVWPAGLPARGAVTSDRIAAQ